jgi:4'-phosphopantetheinyl transferase EntD
MCVVAEPPPITEGLRLTLIGAPIAELPFDLTPREAALVAHAVPKRARELAAGRALARRCLHAMGRPVAEILATSHGVPLWPEGLSGSISHTDDYCAVVLGETCDVGHVGIDVEDLGRVSSELWPHTLVPEELAYLDTIARADRSDVATIFFSAKEAFYKAQFPRTRTMLEFHDVTIRLDGSSFVAEVARDVAGLPGRVFRGRLAVVSARVWTLATITA